MSASKIIAMHHSPRTADDTVGDETSSRFTLALDYCKVHDPNFREWVKEQSNSVPEFMQAVYNHQRELIGEISPMVTGADGKPCPLFYDPRTPSQRDADEFDREVSQTNEGARP